MSVCVLLQTQATTYPCQINLMDHKKRHWLLTVMKIIFFFFFSLLSGSLWFIVPFSPAQPSLQEKLMTKVQLSWIRDPWPRASVSLTVFFFFTRTVAIIHQLSSRTFLQICVCLWQNTFFYFSFFNFSSRGVTAHSLSQTKDTTRTT